MVNLFKALIIFLFTSLISLSTAATESRPDKFIEANGLKIHYQEEGNGPPLLLIHGGGLTSKSWKEWQLLPRRIFVSLCLTVVVMV